VKWKRCAAAAHRDGVTLEYSGETITSPLCRLCNTPLKLNRTQPDVGTVVYIQPCACRAGANVVNLDRFLSIFPEEQAERFYEDLKSRKQKNWTTKGLDVGSRDFFIRKYGPDDGLKRFTNKVQKCTTTNQGYFERCGLTSEEAKLALRDRQSTRSLDKAFLKHGEAGVKKWIMTNATWRNKLARDSVVHNFLEPELIQSAQHKAQYWWLVTVLTDLSRRLENVETPLGFEVDHKFSRSAGFHLGISPKIICAAPNLRVIKQEVNQSKKDLCSVTQYNLNHDYELFIQGASGKLYDDISETLLRCVGYQWAGW